MPDRSPAGDGADHDSGASGDTEPRVVVHDRRRIDPRTGAVRAPHASGADAASAPPQPEQEDDVTDSAIGGVPTSGADVAGDDAHSTEDAPGFPDATAGSTVPPPDADGGTSGTNGDGATSELDRVQAELAERTADLQRVSAEYANYRRRIDRDRESTVSAAKAQVAGELMTVLDDVDRAASHGDLTGGFKIVADRLTETLQRVGLTPFGEEGDAFDPAVHEAVAQESSADVSGPTVTTVMRRGYRFGERVLRPAMVAVTDHDPTAAPTASAPTASDPDAASPLEVDLPESAAAGNPGAINPDAT